MTQDLTNKNLTKKIKQLEEKLLASIGAEEALRESQRTLSTLMSNLPGMAYRCLNDADWTMEFVSDGAFPLTDYQADQLVWNRKVSYAQLINPEDRKDVWHGVQRSLRKKEPFRLIYRIRTASGEERWVWEQGIGIFTPEGELVALEGFISDITENKRTAEQLSVLLESLPIVPYMCRADGHFGITYVGNAVKEITGFSPEQFVRDPTFWFDHVHPDDRKTFFEELPSLFVSGKYQHEYRFRTSDMSFKWFRDIRRVVNMPDGRPSHIVGTWQDTTTEKKLLQESEYRLQQVIQADKLASLGEVVAGVAHEINNPNSFITNNIPLLAETWAMFEPILEDYRAAHPERRICGFELEELCRDMHTIIQSIKIGSERINRVVSNLKDFARPNVSEETKPVQINEVIERAFTIVGAQVRKLTGKINLNLAEGLPAIEGHLQKLEQVVANLLVNAAYAIPEKERGVISISTRLLNRLDTVVFQIEDNGIGMEPGVMEQIFDPFYTTRRDRGGTGLGLSVSYRLIQEHNGIIGVLSQKGLGTRFTVFLPRSPESIKLNLRPAILCMDDDIGFLKKLQSDLDEIRNLSFETRIKPESVLDYLRKHPEVDVLLLKIMIPAEDGWQLYDMIRETFPLLTLVLYSSETLSLRDKPKGVPDPDHFLKIPFEMEQLVKIISKIQRQIL